MPLRWLTLIMIVLNVLFNGLYQFMLPGSMSIKDVTNRYHSLFSPAPYVFIIWSVIYAGFIAYGIYQLIPSQRKRSMYDVIAAPVIAANVFCSMWIAAFSLQLLDLSVMIIAAVLISALTIFRRIDRYRASYPKWLLATFSIFAGWISVASIAAVSIYLVSEGWRGSPISEGMWTMIMLLVAAVLGFLVTLVYRDMFFALVIVWAAVGIWVANLHVNHLAAYSALVIAALLMAWIAAYLNLSVSRLMHRWEKVKSL